VIFEMQLFGIMRKCGSFCLVFGLVLLVCMPKCYALSKADSLAMLLKQLPENTRYVEVVNQYLWYLLNAHNDEKRAEELLSKTEKLAIKLNDYQGLQRLYWYHGFLCSRQEHQQAALAYLKKAYYLVEKYHLSVNERQRVLAQIGVTYYYLNRFDGALKYLLEAIDLTEKYNLTDYTTEAYLVTSRIMYSLNRQKAFQYAEKALKMAYRDQDSTRRYSAELNISGFYTGKKQLPIVLYHSRKALYWAEKYCRKAMLVSCWSNLAMTYAELNRKDSALYYLQKAQILAESLNDINRKSDVYLTLASFYYEAENYTLAENYCLKALELAEQVGDAPKTKSVYSGLIEIYARTRHYQKAFYFQSKARTLEDSLFSKNMALKVRDLTDKIEKEKREANLKLLQAEKQNAVFQRNMFLIVGALAVFLALISVFFIINRAKLRRLKETQSLRNRLATDLHDEIGSTLSSISLLSGLTERQMIANQPQKAEQLIQKISQDSRQMLESMDDIVWTINPRNDSMSTLLTRLREYAKPLAESKAIDLIFVVTPEIENSTLALNVRQNLYLIVKEAINNLFKYAQATKAEIRFGKKGKSLEVIVKDNGVGFDANGISNRNGLKNMHERAATVGAKLTINSNPENGTVLSLLIPE
jgi:signal transduction histidine kinase